MDSSIVKYYTKQDIKNLIRFRSGETKVGEKVLVAGRNWKKSLESTEAKFILLGIPEDVGVRANYGRAGANTAYKPALESFLNQQYNAFLDADEIMVLGEVFVEDLMEKSNGLNIKVKSDVLLLREFVSEVDNRVTEVMKHIVLCGKIPIVIGGGHNNAYGNIKGTSLALDKKINVINCDPHLDFRSLEGRHSGNGFSYALEEGYMNKYSVFALHEQYNNKISLDKFKNTPTQLFYNTYESIFVREELTVSKAIEQCIGFVKGGPCGVEIDLDAITNVPSSAKTSSGISPVEARQFVYRAGSELKVVYLHVAEGAPVLSHIKADNKTGKLIAYLIGDFIKGTMNRT